MQQFGRKKIIRHIARDHSTVCFKPYGIKGKYLEKMIPDEDEMEAIMGISRSTFSRLLQ